jgi:hypothetical protein
MGGAGTCVVTSLVQRVMSVRVIRILAPGVHAVILAWAWDAGCIRFSNRGRSSDVDIYCGITKGS